MSDDPQVPPRASGASAIVTGAPPSTATFISVTLAGGDVDIVERHADRARAAAPFGRPPPRDIHQHAAHHLRRHAEEMSPVLPPDLVPAEQPEANLVDERGRLHRHGRPLAGQVAEGHPVELIVDQRNQPLERAVVPIGPDAQHLRDLVVRGAIG